MKVIKIPTRILISMLALVTLAAAPATVRPDTARQDRATLASLSRGVTAIARSASAAVVFLSVSKTVESAPAGMLDPFDFFFGPRLGPRFGPEGERQGPGLRTPESQRQQRQQGVGSGFFFDLSKGLVLTNNHVVEGADEIQVHLAGGRQATAKVVGRDENTDLAVVRVEPADFPREGLAQLEFADSEKVAVGQLAVALGAPFGLESSLSLGVVSATGRGTLGITQLGDFLQTDAAVNPGNSGGPLVDVAAQVIGVNTAIFSQTGASAGIGFAIPATMAKLVADRLVEDGKFSRGYLGVGLQPLAPELAESLDVPAGMNGAIVASVEPGSPGAKAKLEPGDVIVEVDGQPLSSEVALVNKIGFLEPGTEVSLGVWRKGKRRVVEVELGAWPETPAPVARAEPAGETGEDVSYGLALTPLDDTLRQRLQTEVEHGLVVTSVAPDSAALKAGLARGDIILQVDRQDVDSVEAFKRLVDKDGESHVLYVQRGEGRFFAALRRQAPERQRGESH